MSYPFSPIATRAKLLSLFMRLLDRYLLHQLMLPLGVCLGGFLVFWVAFDLFSELSNFQQQNVGWSDIAQLYWLRLPQLLLTILPVGLLLALLYALTQHARYHELTAMRSAGISLWRICMPYYAVGLLLSGALYWVNEVVAADARGREEALRAGWADPALANRDRSWRYNVSFFNHADVRSWSVGGFNLVTGELLQPRVAFFLPKGARQELVADGARWSAPGGSNGVWILTNGVDGLYRTSEDATPARRRRPIQTLAAAELGGDPVALTNWPFGSLLNLTNGVVYTHLKSLGGKHLPEWEIEQLNPLTGELSGLRGAAPVESGARRMIVAEMGLWTNSAWTFLRAREYLYRSGSDVYPIEVTSAEMRLPELTEDPEMIRSEVRVTGLLRQTKLLRKPELSSREIRNFMRLHPELRRADRMLLETQLQARLAAPWTCLVVTLIAVPFGTPSGRRNIFYGVAGSIALAFGYFILQRVGFAVGQRGTLSPWLAAWLPNLFFGLLGLALTHRVR